MLRADHMLASSSEQVLLFQKTPVQFPVPTSNSSYPSRYKGFDILCWLLRTPELMSCAHTHTQMRTQFKIFLIFKKKKTAHEPITAVVAITRASSQHTSMCHQHGWSRSLQDPTLIWGAFGSWWLLRDEKFIFLGNTATGRLPVLQGMALRLCTSWIKWVIKIFKKRI